MSSANNLVQRALNAWMGVVVRRPGAIVLIGLALTILAAIVVSRNFSINTDTADLISKDLPFRRNSLEFKREFPSFDDQIVAVVDAPTPEAADQAARALAQALAARKSAFLGVYLPGSEPHFDKNGLLYLSYDELADLANRLAAAQPLLATLVEDPSLRGLEDVVSRALENGDSDEIEGLAALFKEMALVADAQSQARPRNLSWQRMFSGEDDKNAARRVLLLQPVLDYTRLKPAVGAMRAVRETAQRLGLDARKGVSVRLTGPAALATEELESVALGGRTSGLASLILVTVLLVIGLRSWRLVVAAVVTLAMGLIWTAAFALTAVGALNLISVAFAVLFIGLGIDFGIHVTLRYREEAYADPDRKRAIIHSGVGVGGALALSAIAAAAGFFSFLPTDYRGLAELGLIAGVGMFAALIANLTVLPALIMLFRPPRPRRPVATIGSPLARLVRNASGPVVVAAAVLGVAALPTLPLMPFDFNPLNLKDPNSESVATFLDLASDPDTGAYRVDILANDLPAAAALKARLEPLEAVGRVLTLESFVPGDQERKVAIVEEMAFFLLPALGFGLDTPPVVTPADRRDAFARLRGDVAAAVGLEGKLGESAARLSRSLAKIQPESDTAASAYERRLVAYVPDFRARLEASLEAEPFTLDDLPAQLTARWIGVDGRTRVEVHPAQAITGNDALAAFGKTILALVPTATGTPILVTKAAETVIAAFKTATIVTTLAIIVILLIVLRRARDILLILVPLAFAAVMTIATAVVLDMPFNFANVIVLPLLFGLGVASGIHLVMRGREAGGEMEAIISSTPGAVLYSALTTLAAFISLAFSGHQGMTSMGRLLTVAIVHMLIAMLVVLPCLMAVLGRRHARNQR